MKRFHIITAIFVGASILVISIPHLEAIRLWLLIALLFIYASLLVYGASQINSRFFLSAFCQGDSASGKVAITFDDGPSKERSQEILELLQKYDCKASFFLIGSRAEARPELVAMMVRNGHLLGNHSYSHSNFFPFYRGARIQKELEKTNRILEAAGAGPIRFFRPPFGVTNPNVAKGAKASGMEVAGWSIRSFDTRKQAAEKVVTRILNRMGGGDVILLHETSGHILEILDMLLPAIRKAGLSCVRLDQMFDPN